MKKVLLCFIIVYLGVLVYDGSKMIPELKEIYTASYTMEEKRDYLRQSIDENPSLKEKFNIDDVNSISDEKVNEIEAVLKQYLGVAVILMVIIKPLLHTLGILFPVLIIAIPIYLSRKKFKKIKLNNDDFAKEHDYYRDILVSYLPCELSYIDNYELDYYSIVATLLSMENRNIIRVEDNRFVVNNDLDLGSLNQIDKYFVNVINNNQGLVVIKNEDYINIVKSSCLQKGIMIDRKFPALKFVFSIICSIVFYILIWQLIIHSPEIAYFVEKFNNAYLVLAFLLILIVCVGLMSVFPFIEFVKYALLYSMLKRSSNYRTASGELLNHKLEGLKNYLRDFGNLDEKTKSELVLWNDYLIYSVMFGDNKKVLDEYKKSVYIKGGE